MLRFRLLSAARLRGDLPAAGLWAVLVAAGAQPVAAAPPTAAERPPGVTAANGPPVVQSPAAQKPAAQKPAAKKLASEQAESSLVAGTLLKSAQFDRQLIARSIEREVEAALTHARQRMAGEPASAQQELKTILHQVIVAPELSAAQRAALRQRLEVALRETSRRAFEQQRAALEEQETAAAERDRERVARDIDRRQERTKQLLERLASLLSEKRYELAGLVADDVEASADDPAIGSSTQRNIRLAAATRDALAMRTKRQQGVVESLGRVESASIAFVDDEPIIYPQAEQWQEMTARRIKYARTDLKQATPAEARVSRALEALTTFDFVEIPLRDAIDYLKDLHNIEIQFDTKTLEAEGIDLETPVTRRLSGVSLRSALRLLLGSLDLTYTTENEVLLITSADRAAQRVITKVYPVGELVLPIRTPNFTGGFGRLGGFGGQQGQQGQNGGNQFNPLGQNQNNGGGFNQGPF
jgi:hypothetical protein